MSFATSQPIVNKFFGGVDVATTLRTHLLANVGNRKKEKLKTIALAVNVTVRVHPTTMQKKMRRVESFVQDLIN